MNYPYGLTSPAANSLRVLLAVVRALHALEWSWIRGAVLEPNFVRPAPSDDTTSPLSISCNGIPPLQHADFPMDLDSLVVDYAQAAEAILGYGVVRWRAAHQATRHPNRSRVQMFLRFPDSYLSETPEIRDAAEHFCTVRDKRVAHVEPPGSRGDSFSPEFLDVSYPSWSRDWRPFNALLRIGIRLCRVEVNAHLGLPPPDDHSLSLSGGRQFDPTTSVAELVRAMGLPIPRAVDRAPVSSKWYDLPSLP